STDPDWWTELGESLLAGGDAAAAVARLAPVVPELPGDAGVRIVLGAAQLQSGQGEAAVKTLDEAEAIASSARSRRLLAVALATVAAGKLGANDAAGAEPLLARAEPLDPGSAAILRDLGIARLALNKPADAVAVLDRAIKIDTAPTTFMLAARAHALAGDVAAARPLYDRALASAKDEALEISLDWAASELLPGGDPAVAVAALEKTLPQAKSGPLAARHKAALAEARHAAGLAALRAGNATKALELLRGAAQGENTLATRCDLAVSAVAANDTGAAIAALKAIAGQTCPFPPPADTQAAPILLAFTDGLTPRRAPKALEKLTSMTAKATGPAAALLGTAIRVVALEAAADAYRNGDLGAARRYLATARAANAKVGADEVAHNLAVLDLADGRIDAAIAQLERLSGKLPEALVNLGIAYERKGDHAKALDAWRRARKAGVRFAPLPEWIEAKERIYGAEQ
ncbi:MAG TPA: tetratricopeptide repeat protein, partial [Kofleriaceae bacterium]|nr:tetratricopeptide repeat protein [Kofleriaceae bacterium]